MNQIEYIGKQIRHFRKEKGWSAPELGKKLKPEKTGAAVTSWERGRTQPDGDILIQLCMLFGVDIADFYYKTAEYETAINDDDDNSTWVEIPFYGSIAAGEPIEMLDCDETYLVPRKIWAEHPNSGVLIVRGNSWNKEIPDGYCIVVDFDIIEPENEYEPFAFCIDGCTATVKSIQHLENGIRLMPNSYDPTCQPIVIDYAEDTDREVKTLGKVVWAFAPFNYRF